MKKTIETRLGHIRRVRESNPDLAQAIEHISKYELHVHLGGSIRRETIVDLAAKNGVSLPASREDFLNASAPILFFDGEHFWELFHDAYKWHWSCIKSCEDLSRIVFEFLEDSHGQGVVQSEFTLSGSYLMNAFPFDEWVAAVGDGINVCIENILTMIAGKRAYIPPEHSDKVSHFYRATVRAMVRTYGRSPAPQDALILRSFVLPGLVRDFLEGKMDEERVPIVAMKSLGEEYVN